MTNKIIYSRQIMNKLVECGNIPIKSMPNPSKPEFQCWIFEVTEKFNEDLGRIVGGGRNE